MNEGARPDDPNSLRVLTCLQQAYSALREAVDHQPRPDPDAGPAIWIDEIHELRTIMSASAQLVRAFDPSPFTDTVRWSGQGTPATAGVTPAALLIAAHTDLAEAMDHLDQAAACLTAARVKLTHLV